MHRPLRSDRNGRSRRRRSAVVGRGDRRRTGKGGSRGAASRIRFDPMPAIEAQFGRWPIDCAFDRGTGLGLTCDASIDDVIRTHLELA
jgi:hypothetical protein